MKYKVGDKVRIKSKEWWDAQPKDEHGNVCCGNDIFIKAMTEVCGRNATISECNKGFYYISEFGYKWTDEMFEEISENSKSATLSEQLIKDIANVVKSHNLGVTISENEGKLVIEPLKEEVEEDLSIDTPMICSDDKRDFYLRFYAGNKKCFINGFKSSKYIDAIPWNIIIPLDKFNPNDIKESLKYNIVK